MKIKVIAFNPTDEVYYAEEFEEANAFVTHEGVLEVETSDESRVVHFAPRFWVKCESAKGL